MDSTLWQQVLPHQDPIIRRVAKSKYHGKLDCPNSYYQMDVEPPRTCTRRHSKLPFRFFEWPVMPQGLCNAPATWRRFMNWVLRKYIDRICYVYIDNIVIFSNSLKEYLVNLRLVLDALREAGVIVSKKSQLFADEIKFLGHIISSRGGPLLGTPRKSNPSTD
jgi:Reverse transcriptase (RNA-dependent DNA polymerase)